ncbi:MAG: Crp/Fnr family transcriptional regulator [Anaerolineae bacterium]|jgi:CRP-like cAMP-binding protein
MDEMLLLQRIPLFSDLLKEQLQSLAETLERRTYRKGDIILRQGAPGNSLYVIVSGRVRIYTLSTDGYELSVGIYDQGDFFGEMALLNSEPRSANVEALQPTKVLILHRQAFRNHLLSNPHAALHIIETLSQRLRNTTESAEELISLNVRQRVARRLLDLAERYGVVQDDGVLINLDLSQEVIASLVGTTRESANRALSNMREQGIVQVERVRIQVLRPDKLEELLY